MEIGEQITDEYDREFLALMIDIEKRNQGLNKHDRLRVESWVRTFNNEYSVKNYVKSQIT